MYATRLATFTLTASRSSKKKVHLAQSPGQSSGSRSCVPASGRARHPTPSSHLAATTRGVGPQARPRPGGDVPSRARAGPSSDAREHARPDRTSNARGAPDARRPGRGTSAVVRWPVQLGVKPYGHYLQLALII